MDRSFVAQLNDYRITTAEILYWMPDHKHVLQSFVWQNLDLAPRFPALTKFLDFWERNLDGKRAPGAGGQRPADQAGRIRLRLGPIRTCTDCLAPAYSAAVRSTSSATDGMSATPETEWPALQMSFQRLASGLLALGGVDVLGDVDRAALRQIVGIEAGRRDRRAAACWSRAR